jgi:pseudouridine kinase
MNHPQKILVIGGANIDIKGRADDTLTLYTSNPGVVWRSPGGVGRNIAQNLATVGTSVALMTALGSDVDGTWLREDLEKAGVDTSPTIMLSRFRTGTYLAVVDVRGELIAAVSDMSIMAALTPTLIRQTISDIKDISMICVDTNLTPDSLTAVVESAKEQGIRVVCEPVSVVKAKRMMGLLSGLFAITPNQDELAHLSSMPVSSFEDVVAASRRLTDAGTSIVVTTRGASGSVVVTAADVWELAAVKVRPVDVTGAGDAFTAGFVSGLVRGLAADAAAKYGHELAAKVVASDQSVLSADV